MFRSFLLCALGILSGCILYVEPAEGYSSTSYVNDELWFAEAYVSCDYLWGGAHWDLEAVVGASYEYYNSEIDIGVYVDGWDYFPLYADGYGWWTQTIDYSYDCMDSHSFDFVVSDDYGNYNETTVWW